MRPRSLIDTGGMVALLDEDDSWHARCSAAFEQIPMPMGLTLPVLTEATHFFVDHQERMRAVWRFVNSGAVVLMSVGADDLLPIEQLMVKYADRPMDFADATLVRVAERDGLADVLSIDSDFDVYRIGARRSFRRWPGTK